MIRVEAVAPRTGFEVLLRFTDGTERVVDLAPYLHGPIFGPLKHDPELFRQVALDPELGTIYWPNGADIDPDVL